MSKIVLKVYRLLDYLKAKDRVALVKSIRQPLEQVFITSLQKASKAIKELLSTGVGMDKVAVRSASMVDHITELRPFVARVVSDAKNESVRQKGIATTDRAPDVCAEKNIKPTGANVDAVVAQDEQYLSALQRYNESVALLQYLDDKREVFTMFHYLGKAAFKVDSDAKAVGASHRDIDMGEESE